MKRVSNFSQARQQEAARRFYAGADRAGGIEERSVAAPRENE